MFALKTLSVLAVVATVAVAAPTPAEEGVAINKRWGGRGYHWWSESGSTTPTTTVVTVVTETAEAAAPAQPATTTAASTSTPTIGSSTGDYISIVSKWRSAGGLPALTQDSTLEANALKTSTNSVGGLIHELNPGTMAQVLAPGSASDFEEVYVGGWLCEIPSLAGLDGICSTASQGWSYGGQTGHATILTSTSYSKIGCAISSNTNVWACDLA
ncbi:hypothetical protein PV05_10119 [Exophiala xenobiotica]|uniref:SCP domain-containing protein n=1 Tax=Exophiala xenobiotica TaxID=348802 RepID=A0A0D2CNC2_9EURO|nr:uncharacterized protein PV05_10119 [Exophiala xenobiotica]KIW51392.1 hypothetical protein PV05_10119 [Exophiala xenobiotica]